MVCPTHIQQTHAPFNNNNTMYIRNLFTKFRFIVRFNVIHSMHSRSRMGLATIHHHYEPGIHTNTSPFYTVRYLKRHKKNYLKRINIGFCHCLCRLLSRLHYKQFAITGRWKIAIERITNTFLCKWKKNRQQMFILEWIMYRKTTRTRWYHPCDSENQ